MKKAIFILITAISISASSQTVKVDSTGSTIELTTGYYCFSATSYPAGTKEPAMILLCSDGMRITGDTMAAIKSLVDEYKRYQDKYWKAQAVLMHLNLDYLSREIIKRKAFTNAVKEYKKVSD